MPLDGSVHDKMGRKWSQGVEVESWTSNRAGSFAGRLFLKGFAA